MLGRSTKALGFSLTEVIVSIGFLGVLAFVVASVVVGMKEGQSQLSDKDEFGRFMSIMNLNLRNDGNCEQVFSGVQFPLPSATAPGDEIEIVIPNYWNPKPSVPVSNQMLGTLAGASTVISGPVANPRLRIKSIRAHIKPGDPLDVSILNQANGNLVKRYKRYLSEIVIRAQQTDWHGGFTDLAPQPIDIPVYLDPLTGSVQKCLVELEGADVCQMTGSVLDPITNACRPKQQCQIKGVWQQAVCSPNYNPCPGAVPNNATGEYSCPVGTTSNLTGQYNAAAFLASCGKKCTYWVTPTIKLWLCMQCD